MNCKVIQLPWPGSEGLKVLFAEATTSCIAKVNLLDRALGEIT